MGGGRGRARVSDFFQKGSKSKKKQTFFRGEGRWRGGMGASVSEFF